MKKSKLVLSLFILTALVTGLVFAKSNDVITNSVGVKLAYIPAGTFEMGTPLGTKDRQFDELLHKVTLTKPFRIGVTEITQTQWQAVMGTVSCTFKGDDLPVDKVSWTEAEDFCKKLSEKEGKTYRLPTEAEWEYACRAGSTKPVDDIGKAAWYEANSEGKTHPVATKKPNAWGLYDMFGNVLEWCSDYYETDYSDTTVTNPTGPAEGTYRVLRGGSFDYFQPAARCAARCCLQASYKYPRTGLRVVMEVSQ